MVSLYVACKSMYFIHSRFMFSGEEVSLSFPDSSTSQCEASQEACRMISTFKGKVLQLRAALQKNIKVM